MVLGVMGQRRSGILLPITALPSPFGIGDLGPAAYGFVDFLDQAGQSFWQILPLNPTEGAYQHSPYSSFSAFAGNTLLISPELLVQDGFLSEKDARDLPRFSIARVDYDNVAPFKRELLARAYEHFKHNHQLHREFQVFVRKNDFWLEDYALFVAIKESLKGLPWINWPKALKDHQEGALSDFTSSFQESTTQAKFLQFIFFRQWERLKRYCQERGIQLIGDMPIYVNWDSADAWVDPRNFKTDDQGLPRGVAGVPPDYFSVTGQRWGNPVYDWDRLRESGYAWWIARFKHNLRLYDYVRIDHFRGFVQYWEIPWGEPLASRGAWREVPVDDFFATLKRHFKCLPLIAEDLGIITDDVRMIMKRHDLPGMKVLLFAFGEDLEKHPYLPHNFERHCVVYTGTHDNNTVQGWFDHDATAKEKENLLAYLNRPVCAQDVHWAFVDLAMKSSADTAILALQDVLGLGQEARFNKPATTQGNWQWRLLTTQITQRLTQKLHDLTQESHRIIHR